MCHVLADDGVQFLPRTDNARLNQLCIVQKSSLLHLVRRYAAALAAVQTQREHLWCPRTWIQLRIIHNLRRDVAVLRLEWIEGDLFISVLLWFRTPDLPIQSHF